MTEPRFSRAARAAIRAGAASLLAAILVTGVAPSPGGAAEGPRTPPYYASISAGKARMRAGPATTYPALWLYRRADLPIKVVAIYGRWRKVEDPGGVQGWMLTNLLSDQRTGIIRDEIAPMRAEPRSGARMLWRAAPGVVGRISECGRGWCRFDVRGRIGFVETASLWGVDADETLP